MAEPRVPGESGGELTLPCEETIRVADLDMGLRELDCACGETHAVVMDIHPPSRFFPEFLVDVLRQTIETEDDLGEFGTTHLMGIVMEEFPEAVVSEDVSENGSVGYSLVWVTDFDSRRLHEVAVELVVELMEHAISHAENDAAMTEFEEQMLDFDVAEFVEQYRARRDFDDEHDTPA
ncbi:hypothetical protein G9464_05575 [Halostella sp. JP-L12]|uniref:DUF5815 family protein n=1 Tax=Halostella TaxID=1843185 RepID=UPI000EF7B1E9|nr:MULTISPECIES: DUF5815 family protein [Halostella]NHN47067.1 hypothetical protein [Halostella sp. JP-L12]